jgi:hypothetical protein
VTIVTTRPTSNEALGHRREEVGYLPLKRQAANLLFALVSRRCERGSIVVTSNRSFEPWGEIRGDAMVAAALITGSSTRDHDHAQRQELPPLRARLRRRLRFKNQTRWCTFGA